MIYFKSIKYVAILLLLQLNLFATTLLTYNTYDRDDRVDIMLSFDTPYNGKLFLKRVDGGYNVTLENINFNKEITKNVNSPIINQVHIKPIKKGISIILKTEKNIHIVASKTTDGFGLRLRAKITSNPSKMATTKNRPASSNFDKTLLNKPGYDISRYYIVILVLIVLLLLLWFVKKRAINSNSKKSWLFKDNTSENEVKILYRKQIDPKNSVLVLLYMDKKYLVLTGSSNQLLDRFTSDNSTVESDEEFEKMFARNRQKLDEFLKVGNDKLSSYRDKASLDISTKED